MTTGLGLSAYIDVPAYQRAPHGQEIASLLGLNTTTAGATQPVGTTNLQVAASSGYAAGLAWILDGPTSEVVTITGSADGTHVTLAAPGTIFAHAAGVSLSQAGSAGSLAEVILRASSWIEGYCRQGTSATDRSLFALARTERWGMPSLRAFIDPSQVLHLRPGHFPIVSVSLLTVELGFGSTVTFDTSGGELTGGRTLEVPTWLTSGNLPINDLVFLSRGLSRGTRMWAVLSYTGGVPAGSVPYDVQQAAVWMVSDFLAQRANPTGASELQVGKVSRTQRLRGDMKIVSILQQQAQEALQWFRAEAFA